MACAKGIGAKAGLLDQGDLRGLTIKNTFIEFRPEIQSGDGWSRQTSEPAAWDFGRQFSGPAAPLSWSGKDDEEVSRQTSPITTDDGYPGISDIVTDDEVPSTGPPSPRSPYCVDSPGSQSPSAASPCWTSPFSPSWVENGSNSFRPPELPNFPGMPFKQGFMPMEGMLSWSGCASNNMVTLRGVPEDYKMTMLVAEFRNAGFQKGRDFVSVHLPMSAQGMTNAGFCVVVFAKPSARNEFMGAFQGRAMRYSASASPVSAAPSVPLEVMLATQEALREACCSAAAVRRCPGCNCQAEPGFKFCTQCGAPLQGAAAQQQPLQQQPR